MKARTAGTTHRVNDELVWKRRSTAVADLQAGIVVALECSEVHLILLIGFQLIDGLAILFNQTHQDLLKPVLVDQQVRQVRLQLVLDKVSRF